MLITAKRIVSYSKAAKIVKWLPQSRQPLAKTQAFTTPACMPRLTEKPITRLLKNIFKRMPITAKRIVSYSKAAKIVKWLPQSRQPLAKTQAFTTPACMPRLTEKPITRLLKNILIN